MDTSKPDLNLDQGFVSKPYARKKIIRRPDGTTQVVYEDMRTGKLVNPQGYQVIQSDNTVSQNPQPTQGQSVTKADSNQQNSKDKTASQEIVQHTREVQPDTSSPAGSNYYDKPGWMGWAGFVPGPIGLGFKALNLGVNANNTEAVNQQRETLGFPPNSTAKNIGSAMFDQNGYIGDLTTTRTDGTKETAPVGFEATDKNQRTTYTPEEARLHEQLSGSVPASEDETKAAIGTFNNQFPDQNKSFFGGLVASAKGLFGNLFGSSPTPSTGSGIYNGGANVTSGNGGFPDAPSSPDGAKDGSYSSDNSPDDRDNKGSGVTNGGYDHPGLF